ncbi:1-acyl-sn-glycerol-3-phosphate acyltransferase [Spirochaetia bacterium]|nr:1-acyl-sn-glycerol-3-phosphate acyltransferase [Spirochaetia bacterium]GHV21513.1 1-acyl-sn-glycerol-3-phosphate acyltransferase [Spirochaetia bacterium]
MEKVKDIIRTCVGFFWVFFATVFFLPVGVITLLMGCIGLKYIARRVMYKAIQYGTKLIVFSIGCKIVIRGHEDVPNKSMPGICFACNHSGIFDIIILFSTLGQPCGFIAKKEILYVPGINIWLLILGGIALDRKNPRTALQTINKCVDRLKHGFAMLIFPEGTRSKGRGLLPFKNGSFKMVTESKAPVVPVAITGSYEVFEKTGLVKSRTVYITYGKPIPTDEIPAEHARQIISDKVRCEIDKMLKEHEVVS